MPPLQPSGDTGTCCASTVLRYSAASGAPTAIPSQSHCRTFHKSASSTLLLFRVEVSYRKLPVSRKRAKRRSHTRGDQANSWSLPGSRDSLGGDSHGHLPRRPLWGNNQGAGKEREEEKKLKTRRVLSR